MNKTDFFTRKKEEMGVILNEVQRKAVVKTKGPLLLLASPGSGKTTTLIMRIGYLIEEKGVHPSRIKAVTFSRAAAGDMQERFKRFFPMLAPVDFSTIHSLAFEVVREHFRKTRTDYQIIEGEALTEGEADFDAEQPPLQKKLILRNLFKRLNNGSITDDQMEELTTYISFVKNKMIPEEERGGVKCSVPQAERLLWEYETFKRTAAGKLLIDFDDMLTLGNDILGRDRELLRKYQQRYDYVLTDESQDTSLVQHAIVEKLVRRHGNLCVVADDDQSIYSWRGAEPSYLLDFKRFYPQASILFMEQNYRSSHNIVKAANQFIKRNKDRYDKNMFTHNPGADPIRIRCFSDYAYQAKYLAREIQQTENLRETAVLYRNNASSIMLMNEFDRAGIPFYMKDSDNRFFSHWVVEDVLNFMRMTFTDKRPELLESIHMKMNGYVTKQQAAKLKGIGNNESVFDNLIRYVPLQDYQIRLLQETKETFIQMRGMPPKAAIQVIRLRLGYEKAIDRMCERLGFRKEFLIGILNTLEDIAHELETMEEFAARLKHLEAKLRTSKFNKHENAVTFSTFHSAKGLEFERVYMIDLVDGIIPSASDSDKDAAKGSALMEEAVRLFYVGMTRAKQRLELLTYKQRDGEKTEESEFVTHIRSMLSPRPAAAGAERPVSAVPKPSARRAGVSAERQGSGALESGGAKGRDGAEGAVSRTRRGVAALGEEDKPRSGRTAANGSGRGASGDAAAPLRPRGDISAAGNRPRSGERRESADRLRSGHDGGGRSARRAASAPPSAVVETPSAPPFNPHAILSRDSMRAGVRVRHGVFGEGTIEKLGEERIHVRFASGVKALSVAACLQRGLLAPLD